MANRNIGIVLIILFFMTGCQTMGGFGGLRGVYPSGLGSHKVKNTSKVKYHDFDEKKDVSFTAALGSYFHRSALLKEAGKVGPTISFDFHSVSKEKVNGVFHLGYTLFWSFDHFWETNNGVLKQNYWNKDFTNYMLGGGVVFQFRFFERLRISYQPGIALNFLEIDSFGPQNNDYTDITISLAHKLVGEFKLLTMEKNYKGDGKTDELYLGGSIFSYLTPSPLGKFLNNSKYKSMNLENSWAWMVHLKWEFL